MLVTAAHCVDANFNGENPNLMIHVYANTGSGNFGGNPTWSTNDLTVHPSWGGSGAVGSGFDIAVIRVAREDNQTEIIKMATIEEHNQLTRCDFFTVFGTGTTNTGEGTSEQLLKTDDLQWMDCYGAHMQNFAHYQNGNIQGNYYLVPGFDHALCMNATVEYQENGYSAICQGDSGGPLVHKDKLFGVVSYNYPPCNGGMPNVFASVAHFLENGWLNDNTDYDDSADFWCYENCDEHSCDNTTPVQETTSMPGTTVRSCISGRC